MALAATTLFQIDSGATAGNLGGGGFNTGNANFLTNYTATGATGNSPVISTASYTFVAGDVNAWIYVKSGTNWTAGFYKITSVAGGAATVNAAVGAAVQFTNGAWIPNTVAGVATVASPTGGTCGIDYSQKTSAITNNTDLASSNGSTNPASCTSSGSPFGVNHIGNLMRVTAGTNFTQTWYEIVSVSGTTATLDKALGSAASLSSGTFYVGGALSLASSDDAVFELGIGGMVYFVKGSATYTIGGTVSLTAAGSSLKSIEIIGFSTVRGDNPVGSTRPIFDCGTAQWTSAAFWRYKNIQFTSTSASTMNAGADNHFVESKFSCTSGTASRTAFTATSRVICIKCEFVSTAGFGSIGNAGTFIGCYFHDSVDCLRGTSAGNGVRAIKCIFDNGSTSGVNLAAACTDNQLFQDCTFYGAETPAGTGLLAVAGNTNVVVLNNIFYGWSTAISHGTSGQTSCYDFNNMFFNNTTNISNWSLQDPVAGTDPVFTSAASGNFAVSNGTALSGGEPSAYPGGLTTSYPGIGAFQQNAYSTDPGASVVKIGSGYTFRGTSTTGTYTGGDRWSDPGVANVLSGTAYLVNGTTVTGTYSPNFSNPGIANVLYGVSYIYAGTTLTGTLLAPIAASGTAGTVDINAIKENIRFILDANNTTTADAVDLSGNMSTRVKRVMKINPEKIELDVNIFPCVTIFATKKRIQEKTVAATSVSGKRRADLTITIMGIVWNDITSDYREDSADEDVENLMENVEAVLRHYSTLNSSANWNFPTDVTYHSVPFAEEAHMRVGVMDLQVSVFY